MKQTEALRLALEALNYAWGYGTQRLDDKLTKVIPAIKEALAHPEQEPKKLPENAARLIIEAWIYRNYGCGYDYHLSDQDEGTSWMWWINSHPYEDPDAAVGFDGGSCWIDFEGKISDHTIIPDAFNSRLQTITHLEQPKEPEQEPVAWMTPDREGFRIRFSPPENDVPLGWDALYITPPKRTWVGLTDREKSNLWLESRAAIPRFHTYASLVDAKLKEKNT